MIHLTKSIAHYLQMESQLHSMKELAHKNMRMFSMTFLTSLDQIGYALKIKNLVVSWSWIPFLQNVGRTSID
jgi:hypothetical protein